jgi:flagellar basal-body rod protein FlgC
LVNAAETMLVGGLLSVAGVEPRFVTPVAAIAGSGLAAATLGLNVSAANLANANDTSAPGSKSAYAPRAVSQSPTPGGGVSAQVVTLKSAQLLVYNPVSPVAGVSGMVQTPEIDPIDEISNQMAAGHAFSFSLEALKAADDEQKQLLNLKA